MSNECKQDKKVNFIPRKLVIYSYEFVMQDKQQKKKQKRGTHRFTRGTICHWRNHTLSPATCTSSYSLMACCRANLCVAEPCCPGASAVIKLPECRGQERQGRCATTALVASSTSRLLQGFNKRARFHLFSGGGGWSAARKIISFHKQPGREM